MTDITKLTDAQIETSLGQISSEWNLSSDKKEISREFKFKGYYKTIAFVNVLAWIAQEEKHHPDLEVNFGRVLVKYTTHDADGLSELDFKSALRVDQI